MVQRYTPEQAIRDGVITAKLKMRLRDSPQTADHCIHVETFHGTVRLSGFVDSAEAVAVALQLAREVEGVHLIEDLLDTPSIGPRPS